MSFPRLIRRGFQVIALVLLAIPLPADSSFPCSGGSRTKVQIDVPTSTPAYHELNLSVTASGGGSATFFLVYPGGSGITAGSSFFPVTAGAVGSELSATATGGSGSYVIIIRRNPVSGTRGTLPVGAYTLDITGYSDGANIVATLTSSLRTDGSNGSTNLITGSASACLKKPTILLSPDSVSTPVQVGRNIVVRATSNDPDNPPAALAYVDQDGAAGENWVESLSGGQRVGELTFAPTGADYANYQSGQEYDFLFRATDKDDATWTNEASIRIPVANDAPVVTPSDTGDQEFNATQNKWLIDPGETIRVEVSVWDYNLPSVWQDPVIAGATLAGSYSWTTAGGLGTFSYLVACADQGKDFSVSFAAQDKDDTGITGTASVPFRVNILPPVLRLQPETFSPFSVPLGSSAEQTLTLSNESITPLHITIQTNAAGTPAGLEYAEGDNGYFVASNGATACAAPVSQAVSCGTDGALTARYIPLRAGPAPGKSVTLNATNGSGTTTFVLNLGGQGTSPAARDPYSIVTVLDKSGSMQMQSQTPGLRKYEALKQNVALFHEFLAAVSDANDHIGLLKYNQQPDTANRISLGEFPAGHAEITAFINGLDAQGTTSISRAMQAALQELIAETGFPTAVRNRSLLLMTDGRHNTPSLQFGDDFAREFPDIIPSDLQHIRLNVLGYGQEGDLLAEFLDSLKDGFSGQTQTGETRNYSFKPGGAFRHTTDPKKLGLFFVQILLAEHFDAQVCVDDEGSVKLGGDAVEILPIDRTSRKAVFYVTWSDPSVRLYFRLVAPGGEKLYDLCRVGKGFSIAVLPLPYQSGGSRIRHAGDWRLQLSAIPTDVWDRATSSDGRTDVERAIREARSAAEGAEAPTIAYEAALAVEDPLIRAQFDIQGGEHYTGDEITLTARLTEGGRPVLGADDVKVAVSIPGQALGDFLYRNDVHGAVSDSSDPGDSSATQKLADLLAENPGALESLTFEFPMLDDGIRGDLVAQDGVYSLRLAVANGGTATENNGVYSYKFRAGGRTCDGNRFYRTTTIAEHIDSVPDPEESTAAYYYQSPTQARIVLVLKDSFGHYLSPQLGRLYQLYPQQPQSLQFRQVEAQDTLKGEWIFTLESAEGRFRPFLDARELIGIRVGGLGMPEASVPAAIGRIKAPLELFLGLSFYPESSAVGPLVLAGVHGRLPLGTLFSVDGELAYGREPSLSGAGQLLQYSLGAGLDLPLLFFNTQPFLQVSAGRGEFRGFGGDDGTWLLTGSVGARRGWGWRRDAGLSVALRNTLLFDLYGEPLTYNLQVSLGLYWAIKRR